VASKRRATRRRRAPRRARTAPTIVHHEVYARLAQRFKLTIEGYALRFVIRANGRKLGTLSIGKGSIGWKGRSDKRVLPLGWTQFVRVMEHERQERKSRRR
jgi:hypothetical protein